MNFDKLRQLIKEYEKKNFRRQKEFFQKLYDIAKIELRIRQADLEEFFQ